jgi:hypothetical protein
MGCIRILMSPSKRSTTKNEIEKFDFVWNDNNITTYSLPQKYLYEANECDHEIGGFDAMVLL